MRGRKRVADNVAFGASLVPRQADLGLMGSSPQVPALEEVSTSHRCACRCTLGSLNIIENLLRESNKPPIG